MYSSLNSCSLLYITDSTLFGLFFFFYIMGREGEAQGTCGTVIRSSILPQENLVDNLEHLSLVDFVQQKQVEERDHDHQGPCLMVADNVVRSLPKDLKESKILEEVPSTVNTLLHENVNEISSHRKNNTTLKYPEFATFEERLKSYELWTIKSQQPSILSEAGFFYDPRLLESDCTTCFQCGLVLNHWQYSSDPWVEHARFHPQCGFLQDIKGKEFIDQVSSKGEADVDVITNDIEKYHQCDHCGRIFDEPKHFLLHLLLECMEINGNNCEINREELVSFIRDRIETVLEKKNKHYNLQINEKLKRLCQLRNNQVFIYRPEIKAEERKCPICGQNKLLLDCYEHLITEHLKTNDNNVIWVIVIIESLIKKYGDQLLKGKWTSKYDCKYGCGQKFYSDNEVKLHYMEEAKKRMDLVPNNTVCRFCNLDAGSRENLINHISSTHAGLCPKCENFTFNREQDLLNHIENCRPQKVGHKSDKTDCWFIACDLCHRTARPKILIPEMLHHILREHKEESTTKREVNKYKLNPDTIEYIKKFCL